MTAMNRGLTIAIVVAVVAGGLGYWLYQKREPATAVPPPVGIRAGAEEHEVIMSADGFLPANIAVKTGDTVVFVNRDARQRWPASGVHPTHLLCQGFDAFRPMGPNEAYSHTFTAAGECPFHDHLTPALKGTITVTEQ